MSEVPIDDQEKYRGAYPNDRVVIIQQPSQSHFWRNVGICCCLVILFLVLWPIIALLLGLGAIAALCSALS